MIDDVRAALVFTNGDGALDEAMVPGDAGKVAVANLSAWLMERAVGHAHDGAGVNQQQRLIGLWLLPGEKLKPVAAPEPVMIAAVAVSPPPRRA